jgi:hypothetical protein
MVDMALREQTEKNAVDLDTERKAAMISNLMDATEAGADEKGPEDEGPTPG